MSVTSSDYIYMTLWLPLLDKRHQSCVWFSDKILSLQAWDREARPVCSMKLSVWALGWISPAVRVPGVELVTAPAPPPPPSVPPAATPATTSSTLSEATGISVTTNQIYCWEREVINLIHFLLCIPSFCVSIHKGSATCFPKWTKNKALLHVNEEGYNVISLLFLIDFYNNLIQCHGRIGRKAKFWFRLEPNST